MRLVLCLLFLSACDGPPWSRLSDGKHGDDTIDGEPLAIPRLKTPPRLHGAVDDWGDAPVLGPFVDPGAGGEQRKNPVAAIARMGWDDRALYVAYVVRDKDPRSTLGRDDVDPHVWASSSGTELMLQPGDPHDNRDYYELQIDVNGAVFDSHFDDYNAPITGQGSDKVFGHQDWQSHVERAIGRMNGKYYVVEAALPWSALALGRVSIPPKAGDVWRMNLYTFKDGQRRAVAWSSIRGRGNFHKAERFGRVRFAD
jgi:hypothetical protein